MRLFTACLLGLLATPTVAEIYRYTDDQGRTVFTDQPPERQGVERVAPSAINIVPPAAPRQQAPAPPRGEIADPGETVSARYARLAIINLPDGGALRANNGSFDVQVDIEPALAPGHSLRLLLDGQPHGPTARSTRLPVLHADRGTHSLVVQVLNGAGQPIQQSDAVTVTVQRISLHSPARPMPHQ